MVTIGDHVAIDGFTYISTRMSLGDYIHIARCVTIAGGKLSSLTMGNFTNIGDGGRIVCSTDDFRQGLISPVVPLKYRTSINKPVVFEDFATLGVQCCVLPGVTLREGTIVGANSLITSDTEPWTIYGGSPAKSIGKRDSKKALKYAKELGY
jgi:galactoside O-acetyltransferase